MVEPLFQTYQSYQKNLTEETDFETKRCLIVAIWQGRLAEHLAPRGPLVLLSLLVLGWVAWVLGFVGFKNSE